MRADLKRLRRDTTSDPAAASAVAAPAAADQSSDAEIAIGILRRHKGALYAAGGALLVILAVAGVGLYRSLRTGDIAPGSIDSIAVLPFENVGGDPETDICPRAWRAASSTVSPSSPD